MKLTRVRVGRLVSGRDTSPLLDGAVLIEDGRIIEVGPSAAVPTPDGAEELTFPDFTMIPGLVDCHSHLNLPGDGTAIEDAVAEGEALLLLRSGENARRALESGVTSMRDNGAYGRTAFFLKDAIQKGVVPGPRLSVAGRPVTRTGGHCWLLGGEADGVQGVRLAVRQLVKEGADWIKVMATGGGTRNTFPYRTSYNKDELAAAVDEAHACGRLTAAHALCIEGIGAALEAGFDMIVHCNFNDGGGRYSFQSELAKRIADQGVWVNPTLHVGRARVWRLERLAALRPLTTEEATELDKQRRSYAGRSDNFQRLMECGVRLVAGSDSGWSFSPFGAFALEVDAMSEAGLGPTAALAAATYDSARAMGIDHDVGSLEAGKVADFLLVEGNPTLDSKALQNPAAVFLKGERIG